MKSFDSLIGPDTQAALDNARELLTLVTRTMPRDAAKHLVFCRLVDRRLRLTLDHAAWVAKLRFHERQLVRNLQREGLDIKQVSWHVAPSEQDSPDSRPERRAVIPGSRSVAGLEGLARSLDTEDPLAESLHRLAATLRSKGA